MTTDSYHQVLYLLGAGSLGDAVSFVERHVDPGSPGADVATLLEVWRKARTRWSVLAEQEDGAAESIEVRALPPQLDEPLQSFLARDSTRATYDTVPVVPALVEIDRLVVYQPEIDLEKVDALAARIGPGPDLQRVFDLALGAAGDGSGGDWLLARHDHDSWEFTSSEHDFRYLGAYRVDASKVRELASAAGTPGAVAAVALLVGFSTNHVSALRFQDRIVLHNGYHRVYALRRLGVTHVPCMVEVLTSLDEAEVAGASELVERADELIEAPRPPLFRDYFDPMLTRVLRARRLRRHVRLRLDADSPRLARG